MYNTGCSSNGKTVAAATNRWFDSIRDHFVNWSVSVVAARLLGKEEDRVQFPDGPSTKHGTWAYAERRAKGNEFGLLVQREDAWLATRKSGFDSPAGPLNSCGLMVQREDIRLAV